LSEQPQVLIVDDDAEQISLIASMMSNEPFSLITAMTGQRALEVLRSAKPCLAVVDLILPDIPGAQLVQEIRADTRLQTTKIIIVTSFAHYVTADARQLADRVLLKPLSKDKLIDAMRELLSY